MFRRPVKPKRNNAMQSRIRRRALEEEEDQDDDNDTHQDMNVSITKNNDTNLTGDGLNSQQDESYNLLAAKKKSQQAKSSRKNHNKKKRTIVTTSSFGAMQVESTQEEQGEGDAANTQLGHNSNAGSIQVESHPMGTSYNTSSSTSTSKTAANNKTSRYDKDALAELRAQQQYQKQQEQQGKADTAPEGNTAPFVIHQYNQNATGDAPMATTTSSSTSGEAADYIPIGVKKPSQQCHQKQQEKTILAGDDAFETIARDMPSSSSLYYKLQQDQDDHLLERLQHSTPLDKEQYQEQEQLLKGKEEEPQDMEWEAQLTRRAGVSDTNSLSSSHQQNTHIHTANSTPANATASNANLPKQTSSLGQLRQHLRSATSKLQTQQMDSNRIAERRRNQVKQIEEELIHYQHDLKISGKAHEYFQQLRHRLATWIGALRDLNDRVKPLQEALFALQAQVAANSRWKDWQDDVVAILSETDQLERVLGRQSGLEAAVLNATVPDGIDEFGRNVQSQYSRQREQRFRRWKEATCVSSSVPLSLAPVPTSPPTNTTVTGSVLDTELDRFVTEKEQEEFRERHMALQKALTVALDEVDEEFTKLQQLVDDFADWQKNYPTEYRQCFTSLSLADLASVLVRVELCALNDPWDESQGYNQGKWTAVIRAARESGVLDQAGTERLVEKSVLPSIESLAAKSGIDLASRQDVQSIGAFLVHVQGLLGDDSAVMEKIRHRLVAFFKLYLDDISIPIVRSDGQGPQEGSSEIEVEMQREAILYTTVRQMHRIKTILANTMTHWIPFLQSDQVFVAELLDFIGSKFLPLLSSLGTIEQPCFFASPSDCFRELWELLLPTQWLMRPECMVLAIPIQAAAVAYGLSEA